MRIAMAIALLVVGCGGLTGDVRLLTGPPKYDYGHGGCFTFSVTGLLVVDPDYGTAIVAEGVNAPTGAVPVAWRPGVTARRFGAEVAVFDPAGNQIAITGTKYNLPGGYVSEGGSSGLVWPELKTSVFWACGTPQAPE
jgi:hypothetical protein